MRWLDQSNYGILSSEWLDVKENIERRLARYDARVVYDQIAVAE